MVYHISTEMDPQKSNTFYIYRMDEKEVDGKIQRESIEEPYIMATVSASFLEQHVKKHATILVNICMEFVDKYGYSFKQPMPELKEISQVLDVVIDKEHFNQIKLRHVPFDRNDPNRFILSYVTDRIALGNLFLEVKKNINFNHHDWWDDVNFWEEYNELAEILHQVVNKTIISLLGEVK